MIKSVFVVLPFCRADIEGEVSKNAGDRCGLIEKRQRKYIDELGAECYRNPRSCSLYHTIGPALLASRKVRRTLSKRQKNIIIYRCCIHLVNFVTKMFYQRYISVERIK